MAAEGIGQGVPAGGMPLLSNPAAHGDSMDVEVASSGSSDTSDPDWGVNWGGTVTSASFPKGAVSSLLARGASSMEEWPSFDPQPAPAKSKTASGVIKPSTPQSPAAHRDDQGPFSFNPFIPSPDAARCVGSDVSRPETPPWPETAGGVSASLQSASGASPFAPLANATAVFGSPGGSGRSGPLLQESLPRWQELQLSVISGPSVGKTYVVLGGTESPGGSAPRIGIGRNSSNTFLLNDDEVSSHHAEIKWDPAAAAWVIRDRGSLNGTLLNGKIISEANRSRGQKHSLSDGDTLRLGTLSEVHVSVSDHYAVEAFAAVRRPELAIPLPELPAADLQPQSPLPTRRTLSIPNRTPAKSLAQTFSAGLHDGAVIGSPAAQLVCASPPRPIRTKSQIPDTAVPAISSPVGTAEERSASYASLGLSAAVRSIVGRQHRLKNQPSEDRCGWELPLAPSELGDCDMALFGVYDGHGGTRAAEEVLRRLPAEISRRLGKILAAAKPRQSLASTGPSSSSSAVSSGSELTSAAIVDAFLQLDESLGCDEGCTATCVLIWRGQVAVDGTQDLYIQAANVGDSAAIFVPLPRDISVSIDSATSSGRGLSASKDQQSTKGEGVTASASRDVENWFEECSRGDGSDDAKGWMPLTTDHRLVNPDEQARLAAVGVHVSKTGRLYGLNLGRSLGDKCLKDADLGLLATPSVSELLRVKKGCAGLVVIASDGLWDTISQAGAVDVILRAARGESTPGLSGVEPKNGGEPTTGTAVVSRVAWALLELAERQKRTDDTTIMVIGVDGT